MHKILMIIAQENFRDEEYLETKKAIEVDGLIVLTAAPKKDFATGSNGATVMPDLSFDEIHAEDYAGIIFVGGQGSKGFVGNEFIEKLITAFDSSEKLIAAICYAPAILATAGFLKNKKATSHLSAKHILTSQKEVEFVNEHVVVAGRYITADGPESAYEFGEAIVKYFKDQD